MDRLAQGPVLVRIASLLKLPQGLARRFRRHHLELEQPDLAIEFQGQVDAAQADGILRGQVQPEGGQMAVEDAGIEALVAGQRVAIVPLMGERRKEAGEVRLEGAKSPDISTS